MGHRARVLLPLSAPSCVPQCPTVSQLCELGSHLIHVRSQAIHAIFNVSDPLGHFADGRQVEKLRMLTLKS